MRIGVSQSAISKFEIERGDIGLRTVTKIADALALVPLVVFVPKGGVLKRLDNPKAVMDMIGEGQSQLLSQISELVVS